MGAGWPAAQGARNSWRPPRHSAHCCLCPGHPAYGGREGTSACGTEPVECRAEKGRTWPGSALPRPGGLREESCDPVSKPQESIRARGL